MSLFLFYINNMNYKINKIKLYINIILTLFDYFKNRLYFCRIINLTTMLPTSCPSCHAQLKVKSLTCESCSTEVTGSYDLPVLALLSDCDQQFILRFVKNSGSLKEMASELKLSYPTVRNMLNEIISKIEAYEK